jgi:hypothetical protein
MGCVLPLLIVSPSATPTNTGTVLITPLVVNNAKLVL